MLIRCFQNASKGIRMKNVKIDFVFAFAAALTMGVCAKDATDGLVGWWRVEQEPNGTVFQAADLRDHAHAGSIASAVNHATEDGDFPAYPICHTNIDLIYPSGCGMIKNASCLSFPQPTNYNASGKAMVNRQGIKFPAHKIDVAGKPCTFIIRMKFGGTRVGKSGFVPIFSYDWNSSNNTGWNFGLYSEGSVNWSWMGACVGRESVPAKFGETYSIPVNKDPNWYDVGLVIEPNMPEIGKTRLVFYRTTTNALDRTDGTGGLVAVDTKVVDTVSGNNNSENRTICIGDAAGSDQWVTVADNTPAFKGLIHEMKLYDRALSVQEFEQACAPYSDPLFTVGSKNGSTDEFSDETAEDVYIPFEMPWWKLRKTLTAENPSLSVKISLADADKDVSRILEFTPFYSEDCPADAGIEVQLNGTKVAEVHRNAETDRLVHLNGKTINKLVSLTDGVYPLTLTMKRIGGMGGSISFDRISLGGGWQLGKRDKNYKEFRTWDGNGKKLYNFYRYFLARQDVYLLAGQMYMPNNDLRMSKQTLCFSISDALAKKGAFVFKTNPLSAGTVAYYLNDNFLCSKTVEYNIDYEVDIPNGLMQGGINELRAEWTVDSQYASSTGFDYMRLTPKRFPRGTIYMIR